MDEMALTARMNEQAWPVTEVGQRERGRLRNWLRRRLADPGEVEDVLQDVFVELVLAYRLVKPIEDVSAWLFRVARNRVTDLFRKKRPEALADQVGATGGDEGLV